MLVRMCNNRNSHASLGENQNGTATLENFLINYIHSSTYQGFSYPQLTAPLKEIILL